MTTIKNKSRCSWCLKDEEYIDYHDNVWGIPEKDEIKLFEYLNLEGAQAGLSWYTILKKRGSYRKAFANWDPLKIIKFDESKKLKLLENPGIIRNKLKVNAVISNAKCYLNLLDEGSTLAEFLWNYVDGKPIVNHWQSTNEVPAVTDLSTQISKDLKKRGFKFVGPTIIYAYMQAIGMVDDHIMSCFRRH